MRSHHFTRIMALLLLLTAGYAAAAGKLYKWQDKDGNVWYQDEPPPEGAESEVLAETIGSPANPASADDSRAPVIVYTVEDCDSCEILLLRLKQLSIPVTERSLLNDRVTQRRILDETGSMQAPSMFIGDTLVPSGTEQELIDQLTGAGYDLSSESPAPAAADASEE